MFTTPNNPGGPAENRLLAEGLKILASGAAHLASLEQLDVADQTTQSFAVEYYMLRAYLVIMDYPKKKKKRKV